MLTGESVVLRARREEDVEVLHLELLDDVDERSRSDTHPWRPVSLGTEAASFRIREPRDEVASFSVVERASGDLAGSCLLWGIDTHNRLAHIGMSLRPAYRGRGLGTDVVRVLCDYAFRTRGLHRVALETLVDNHAMRRAAEKVGFVLEGTLRQAGWVQGEWLDEVLYGLLVEEWTAR